MPLQWPSASLLLLSATLTPCTADELPEARLARFQARIRQDVAQVPNYTCLETMKRSARTPASRTFNPVDTIRIEVTSVSGKEKYAWPGSRQFEDKKLTDFVTSGASGSGLFSLITHELFVNSKATLQYRGDENLEGRRAVRYDYRIPQFVSKLTLRVFDISATVATRGSFWFDPVSLDLIRLDNYGDDMPDSLDLAESMVSIRYARAHIGNSDALLPKQGELMLTHFSGAASRNTIEFSQCHAYQAESTISFDAPSADAASLPKSKVREVRLPAGLLVPVILETAIDSTTAALGDAVRARVREDVRREGSVVLPAGAVISGRIRRLDRRVIGEPYFVIGMDLFEVEWGNARADFYGELVESYARKGITAGYATRGSLTYTLRGKRFHIDPGLGFLWRVLDRPPE